MAYFSLSLEVMLKNLIEHIMFTLHFCWLSVELQGVIIFNSFSIFFLAFFQENVGGFWGFFWKIVNGKPVTSFDIWFYRKTYHFYLLTSNVKLTSFSVFMVYHFDL